MRKVDTGLSSIRTGKEGALGRVRNDQVQLTPNDLAVQILMLNNIRLKGLALPTHSDRRLLTGIDLGLRVLTVGVQVIIKLEEADFIRLTCSNRSEGRMLTEYLRNASSRKPSTVVPGNAVRAR